MSRQRESKQRKQMGYSTPQGRKAPNPPREQGQPQRKINYGKMWLPVLVGASVILSYNLQTDMPFTLRVVIQSVVLTAAMWYAREVGRNS